MTPLPDVQITIGQDFIDTRTVYGKEPDPKWIGTDSHGHPHAQAIISQTCTAKLGPSYWCDLCGGNHEDFQGWHCNQCGEKVEVPMVPERGYIPGLVHGRVVTVREEPGRVIREEWATPGYLTDAFAALTRVPNLRPADVLPLLRAHAHRVSSATEPPRTEIR